MKWEKQKDIEGPDYIDLVEFYSISSRDHWRILNTELTLSDLHFEKVFRDDLEKNEEFVEENEE